MFKLRKDVWMLAAFIVLLAGSTNLDNPNIISQEAHGGNISNLEIEIHLTTIHWQGYAGNVTVQTTSPIYSPGYFNESEPAIGTIRQLELGISSTPDGYLLITNSPQVLKLSSLKPGNISIIDNITGTGIDSGTNTFKNTSTYSIPGVGTINNVPTVYTFVNGKEQYTDFKEGFLEDGDGNMVFVAPVGMPTQGYDGITYNFQFIVPNKYHPDPLTYYIYYVSAETRIEPSKASNDLPSPKVGNITPTEVVAPAPTPTLTPTPTVVGTTEPIVPPESSRVRLIIFLIIFVLVFTSAVVYVWQKYSKGND